VTLEKPDSEILLHGERAQENSAALAMGSAAY
jgi:hypothetical protein